MVSSQQMVVDVVIIIGEEKGSRQGEQWWQTKRFRWRWEQAVDSTVLGWAGDTCRHRGERKVRQALL